jgi:putative oxidoreductase
VGLLTPLGAALAIRAMVTVAAAGHGKGGLWNHNGGYELPLLYGAIAAGLALVGPGAFALDAALHLPVLGNQPGAVAIATGLAAGGLALASRRVTPVVGRAQLGT